MWKDWYFSCLREKNKDIKIQQPFFILTLSPEHRVPAIPAGSITEEFKSTKRLGISLAIKAPDPNLLWNHELVPDSASGSMMASTFLRLHHTYLSKHVKVAGTLTNKPSVTANVQQSGKTGHRPWSTWQRCVPRQRHLNLVGTMLKNKYAVSMTLGGFWVTLQ